MVVPLCIRYAEWQETSQKLRIRCPPYSVQPEVFSREDPLVAAVDHQHLVSFLSSFPAEIDRQISRHELRDMAVWTDDEPSFTAALRPHAPDPQRILPATSACRKRSTRLAYTESISPGAPTNGSNRTAHPHRLADELGRHLELA